MLRKLTPIKLFVKDFRLLRMVANTLKRLCGTGGTVKDGIIIIQGDHRETLLKE
ncbi:MAG: translation initiation factor, partial [Deltaproteobacteria bacterium]|nr:translation initiation factor [Deltaproteobacteria bacterium]